MGGKCYRHDFSYYHVFQLLTSLILLIENMFGRLLLKVYDKNDLLHQ
jgi:hypothetical protein